MLGYDEDDWRTPGTSLGAGPPDDDDDRHYTPPPRHADPRPRSIYLVEVERLRALLAPFVRAAKVLTTADDPDGPLVIVASGMRAEGQVIRVTDLQALLGEPDAR